MNNRATATIHGKPYAYWSTTATPDVPVLFLHGLGDDADTWRDIVDGLGDRYSIALDQRGHGQSPWTDGYELDSMVEDVTGLLDALDLPRVDLVGHSMGAMVAYVFASRHPARVRTLVLEEAPPPEPADPPRDEGDRPDRELAYDWGIQAPFSRQRNQPDPAWFDELSAITASTLVMTGTESHLSADASARMAARIPDSKTISFPTGHEIHSAFPADFTQALRDFLEPPQPR